MAESIDNKEDMNPEIEESLTAEPKVENTETETVSMNSDTSSDADSKVVKFIKSIFPTVIIGFGSFLLVFLLHYFGAFNTLELKLYDLRLKLRGPLSGITSNSALPNAESFIDKTERSVLFTGISNAKFRKPVLPLDEILFEVKIINKVKSIYKFYGEAKRDSEKVCEAIFSAMIINKAIKEIF